MLARRAQFADIKIRSDRAGKKGVCGTINAKNAFGGFTGPKLFVFDGEYARILISDGGAGNSTSLSTDVLGVMLGDTLAAHDRFCK